MNLFRQMQLRQYSCSLGELAGMTGKSRHSHDQCLTAYLNIDLQDTVPMMVLRLKRPRARFQTLPSEGLKASSTHRHLGQILVDLALLQASIIHVGFTFGAQSHILPRCRNMPQLKGFQRGTAARLVLLTQSNPLLSVTQNGSA